MDEFVDEFIDDGSVARLGFTNPGNKFEKKFPSRIGSVVSQISSALVDSSKVATTKSTNVEMPSISAANHPRPLSR